MIIFGACPIKKILLITAFVPSRESGGQVFTKSLMKDLEETYSLDTIVISRKPEHKKSNSPNLRVFVLNKYWITFRTIVFAFLNPLFIRRFSIRTLVQLKKHCARNAYDLIIFEYSQIFLYALFFPHSKKVLSYQDVMFQKFYRERFPLSLLAIPSYLLELCFSKLPNTTFFSPTAKDAMLLKSYYNQRSTVINYYLNDHVLALDQFAPSHTRRFVFFGDWTRSENAEGLEWFLKSMNATELAQYQFTIIGRGLSDSLRRLISGLDNVEYLGFVENPYRTIAEATALIAPIFRGAGIKIKVIEALACGTPVLGTSIAFEGTPDGFQQYLILCRTIDEYALHLKTISMNKIERSHLRSRFIEEYSKNSAGSVIRSMLG